MSASEPPKKRDGRAELSETTGNSPSEGDDPGATVVPPDSTLDQTVVPADSSDGLRETVAVHETGVPDSATSGPAKQRKDTVAVEDKKNGDNGRKKVTQLGDFKLTKKLGKGGMGVVYLADQVSLDRKVALKTLSKELADREDFVQRFQREARSMAKLDHNNIVKVYTVAHLQGIHFVAIEYVDGRSVQDWLDELGKLSVGDALHITLSCAEGMLHAHEKGMVHRDIKPDNILITKQGVVKVADFGLAKAMDEDVSMTQSGTGMGTPLYMAPEQARNAKHVDQRSDIYALGATLYHMVTGALPFLGDTTLELMMNKEEGKFDPARRINKEVPERMDLIIDRMLAKDPAHRYSGCDDILRDLSTLELDNPTLSFIDGAEPSAEQRSRAARTSGSGVSTTRAAPTGTRSSRADAQEGQGLQKPHEKNWYVHHRNSKGKSVLSKWTTDQVFRAIKSGSIDPSCKAKDAPDADFQPLAQYPEFMSALESQVVKKKAEFKANSMVAIYKQIDRADRRKRRWRWLKNLTEGTLGYAGLLIWLATIAGVIWILFWEVYPYLCEQFARYLKLDQTVP